MADEQAIILSGGNVNTVVRVGNTVRRNTGFWSETVHGLLEHLHAQGFAGAPKFLGFDEQGREILTYLEGEVGNYPLPAYMWSDAILAELAHFLRAFHTATASYRPNAANWQMIYPDSQRHEVICHNDFAPYNLVFVNQKPTYLIDFDTAGPGPRVWDIAYAVYRFVPLSWADDMQALGLAEINAQRRRLALFCKEYGLEDWQEVLPMVEQRIEALANHLVDGAARGEAVYQKMIDEGHLAHYQRELAAFRQQRTALAKFLEMQPK